MLEKKIELNNKEGIHARPASIIVEKATKYSSDISLIKDDKEVNAKSIMGIMSLGIRHKQELIVKADGEDEKEVVEALIEVLSSFN